MYIPDIPYIPLRLNDKGKEFLRSLEDRVDVIIAAGFDGYITLNVFGIKGSASFIDNKIEGYFVKEYKIVKKYLNIGLDEVSEESFKDPLKPFWPIVATAGLYMLSSSYRIGRRREKEFWRKANQIKQQNTEEMEGEVRHIRLYQGSIKEVERDLDTVLTRVDTKKPETYLHAENPLMLRVRAHLLGANAVVHYQPSSAIGTPVKFKEK